MEGFHYSSSSTHGIITPQGKKLKTTSVNVENGRGSITMSVEDEKGAHSDTRLLTPKEIKNIKSHKFMPNLFKSTLKNIFSAKNSTKKVRRSKKVTRKQK